MIKNMEETRERGLVNPKTLGVSLKYRSTSICQFNFDLSPLCKTCSWSHFEVLKNDLKECILEIAALLHSQEKVGSALLAESAPPGSFVHALYRTFGYHYVAFLCILFSLVFHCWGILPK